MRTTRASGITPYHSKYNPVQRVWGALENAWNGDLLDTIPAALHHAQSMKWNGNHPVVRFIDRIIGVSSSAPVTPLTRAAPNSHATRYWFGPATRDVGPTRDGSKGAHAVGGVFTAAGTRLVLG